MALVASLLAAVYLIENYRGAAAWERYRSDAIARGVKLDFRDFIPPPIPDEENFAKAPFFADWTSSDPAAKARAVEAAIIGSDAGSLWTPVAGRTGGSVDLAGWQQYFVEHQFLRSATKSPAADVLKAMERCEPALAQLREAASRPASRLDLDWEKGSGPNLDSLSKWPNGSTLRLSETLELRIAALLALHRDADAIADWHTMYRLHALLKGQPTLLPGMLRVMLVSGAVNSAWQGLTAHQWSAASLQHIETNLATCSLLEDHRFSMSSERAFLNALTATLEAVPAMERPRLLGKWFGFAPNRRAGWGMLPLGWFYQNQVRINQWHDLYLAGIDGSPTQSQSLEVVAQESGRRRKAWLFRPYSFLQDLVLYGVGGILDTVRGVETDLQLCRAACALERFRLRTGAYPQTLENLVPVDLAALPLDGFSHPFRYRQSDRELVLYSEGGNGRDDGGGDDDLAWRSPPLDASAR